MNSNENWTKSYLSRASEIKSWSVIEDAELRARFTRNNVKVNVAQEGSFTCLTCTNFWPKEMVCFDELFCTLIKVQKQILLFTFEPKKKQNYFLIIALASKMGQIKKMKAFYYMY